MTFLMGGLLVAGTCVLIASLVPVQLLIARLPQGAVRRQWYILRVLIFLFIAGYIVYAAYNWSDSGKLLDLVVPAIFFFGACFVFLVNNLSLQTARDVRRLAVLELETILDPLMGIHNRRYLDRRLKEEVERALRYKLPLSVLLLDIDHFKRVNDSRGHQVGDLVLSSLGRLIKNTARNSDVVARYGGEEILVIATNTASSSVPAFAERLRKAVEDCAFAERLRKAVEESVLVPPDGLGGAQAVRVTVSIGVASLGPDTCSVDALLKSADEALFRAKREGRNRVVVQGTRSSGHEPDALSPES
jgi:diguanylate cyclase (GGDEF)-like protein